jgi:catechol 2,3-dioxygenase-like lactoylglutathione lyase family enzyme
MPGGIDHIVHAVRDLEAAAEFYRGAGFSVGALNRHPWGTHNRIVQFAGSFVELISVGEPDLIEPHRPGSFSFGGFVRDFLAREEGLSMLVLEGKDAAADAEAFRAARIGNFRVFDFAREATRPDGAKAQVAFSLAFATDVKAPAVGFFTCQQHHPGNFWNPVLQTHRNGATGIMGVTMVAENPGDHRSFLSAFSGISEVKQNPGGIAVVTRRGEIRVVSPSAYRSLVGTEPPSLARGARLAAICFSVRDMAGLTSAFAKAGIRALEHEGCLVVPPDVAYGGTLVFKTPAKS